MARRFSKPYEPVRAASLNSLHSTPLYKLVIGDANLQALSGLIITLVIRRSLILYPDRGAVRNDKTLTMETTAKLRRKQTVEMDIEGHERNHHKHQYQRHESEADIGQRHGTARDYGEDYKPPPAPDPLSEGKTLIG